MPERSEKWKVGGHKSMGRAVSVVVFVVLSVTTAIAQEQRFANLGDFKLKSGAVLRDCRIGYRTFGELNSTRSNVIVMATWAGGTTEQLSGSVGPGKLADTSKYYVVLVDALANGVS